MLVFFVVFMDPVVKPRGDTLDFIGPRNNTTFLANTGFNIK
nr:hypothetical protein [Rickettsia asembonensis]